MGIREILKGERCEYPKCRKIAKVLYFERNDLKFKKYCRAHGKIITNKATFFDAEYIGECPNCGCHFKVN